MLPVTNDVAAKEGRQLNNGLVVLHGLALLNCKAHYLSRLRRLRMRHTSASDGDRAHREHSYAVERSQQWMQQPACAWRVGLRFSHALWQPLGCFWLSVELHTRALRQGRVRPCAEAHLHGHEGPQLLYEAQHLPGLHLIALAQQHMRVSTRNPGGTSHRLSALAPPTRQGRTSRLGRALSIDW